MLIFDTAQKQAAGRISAISFTAQGTLVTLQKRAHKNKPTTKIVLLSRLLVDHDPLHYSPPSTVSESHLDLAWI